MTSTNNKYADMSRDYMARAEDYLGQGDLVQASEKCWGAAACVLKAIAERRAWRHQSHSLLYDISSQIADEQSRPELRDMFVEANSMHQNFYEDWMPEEVVERVVGRVKAYLAELDAVGLELPASFLVESRAQRRRLERLTGQSMPL